MHSRRPVTSYGAELRCIARQAAASLGRLPYAGRGTRLDSSLARGGILVLAPFLFAEALPFDGSLERARTIALANAYGAAHFLAQDRLLDGDEAASPEACHFSDLALSLFAREHGRIFDAEHPFWQHFERYLGEYFESLSWERVVLRSAEGRRAVEPGALDASLRELGRRLSPSSPPRRALPSWQVVRTGWPAWRRSSRTTTRRTSSPTTSRTSSTTRGRDAGPCPSG